MLQGYVSMSYNKAVGYNCQKIRIWSWVSLRAHLWESESYLCVYAAPVGRCGEHPQDDVPAVHPDDGAGGVEQVEVEVGVAGHGAVEAGLQERRPLLLQDALRAALVAFTHPGHARHHHLWIVRHRSRCRDREWYSTPDHVIFTTVLDIPKKKVLLQMWHILMKDRSDMLISSMV